MLITELFDNPAEWKVTGEDHGLFEFSFEIENKLFNVELERSVISTTEIHVYSVNFAMTPLGHYGQTTFDISGTGDQYEVFATVKDIVKEFVSKNKVDVITFAASEPSRISLYTKLTPMVQKLGFPASGTTDNPNNGTKYFFSARDKEILKVTIARFEKMKLQYPTY